MYWTELDFSLISCHNLKSQTIEFMLVETSEGHLVQPHTQSRGNLKVSQGFSRPCPAEFLISLKMEIPQLVWPICFQCLTTLTVIFFSLYLVRISLCVTIAPCPFAIHLCEEWGSVLHVTIHQDRWRQQLELFLLQPEQTALPWPLCTASAPAPGSLWWLSVELTSTWHPAPEVAFQVFCRGKKPFPSTCWLLFC